MNISGCFTVENILLAAGPAVVFFLLLGAGLIMRKIIFLKLAHDEDKDAAE